MQLGEELKILLRLRGAVKGMGESLKSILRKYTLRNPWGEKTKWEKRASLGKGHTQPIRTVSCVPPLPSSQMTYALRPGARPPRFQRWAR